MAFTTEVTAASSSTLPDVSSEFSAEDLSASTIDKPTSSAASFHEIIPMPKRSTTSLEPRKKRRVGHAEIITSSPYKTTLRQEKEVQASKKLKLESKKMNQVKQRKVSSKARPTANSGSVNVIGKSDRTPCMFCEILHCESTVSWYRCKNCQQWACGLCAHMGRKKVFVCDTCK